MIGEKWLSDVVFTTVKSKADISKVKNASIGDFQTKDLSQAVNTSETNEVTVRAWKNKAIDRKSTLVFCVDLNHVADLTRTFHNHGINANFVTGETPRKVRSERLEAFKAGGITVLLNCGVFTEGTDIPNIDCVILARPTKSRNLLVQMIGRGMRLFPGKLNCHVIDMVASLEVGVVTTPTLFGLDPEAMFEEASVVDMKSEKDRQESEKAREVHSLDTQSQTLNEHELVPRLITFTDYESVHDLIEDTAGERHIRKISALAWVLVGDERYLLSTQQGSYVTIERSEAKDEGEFHVIFTQKLPEDVKVATNIGSPYMRPREIAASGKFEDAVHAADTFAVERFPYMMINHNQSWRKAPATEGQLSFLNKSRDVDDQLSSEALTKGRAADMITKMKFGAKGRFNKISVARRREHRATEKTRQVEELKKREHVKVGPTQG